MPVTVLALPLETVIIPWCVCSFSLELLMSNVDVAVASSLSLIFRDLSRALQEA